MVGNTIAHYRVTAKLGAGGMGEVYRARDTKLERDVALKLIPESALTDPAARERLVHEARTASHLNHPNICTIHEVGEAAGNYFIAMELVEGKPLSGLIGHEGLHIEQVIHYGTQIADALAHAHERGVIHRDLKPANVMITPEGRAKVLDFGLATRTRSELDDATRSRVSLEQKDAIAGTLPYMAPEVLRGKLADARSDIWAFGVLLYEMAAGALPFRGDSGFDLTSAILRDAPPPMSAPVPPGLAKIVHSCLAKETAQRYQRAGEIRAALETITLQSIYGPHPVSQEIKISAPSPPALARRPIQQSALFHIDCIAVFPLANPNPDPDLEYLAVGIPGSIIHSLSQMPGLRVIAWNSVARNRDREEDPLAIGRSVGARAVLTGRIWQRGNKLRLHVDLLDTTTGEELWGDQYDRDLTELFSVQDEISHEVSQRLRLKMTREAESRLTKRYTDNVEAYQLYVRARRWCEKRSAEGFKRGTEYLSQAIQMDPNYALAHAELSQCISVPCYYGSVDPNLAYPKARAAALRALEIDPNLAEAHEVLATILKNYDWNWIDAEKEYKRAIELNSNYATAHYHYSYLLAELGRFEEAIREATEALSRDPMSALLNAGLAFVLLHARKLDECIEQALTAAEVDPNMTLCYLIFGTAYEQQGKYREAIEAYKKGIALGGAVALSKAFIGHVYAKIGEREKALDVLRQLQELSKTRYVPSVASAIVYDGLMEKDFAIEALNRACENRDTDLIMIKVWPHFDNLRDDPRFQEIERRVGLRQ